MREPVYVVVGAHRGGTSAVAKGLSALGVSLGDNLMPPVAGNNERGFWEDVDVVGLNEEVLAALNEPWHSVRLFDEHGIEPARLRELVAKGGELLRTRIAAFSPYGFKDPRSARLLFYWEKVFRSLDIEPRYIIALRNPLSVAKSLEKRDHFSAEKSHVLWLEHMLDALRWTKGRPRVVVDYDQLLAEPVPQLLRIRAALKMAPADETLLQEYADEFLTDELRHSEFDADAVEASPQVPRLAARLHRLLDRLATDEISLASGETGRKVRDLWNAMTDLAPAFAFTEAETREIVEYAKVVANRDEQIRQLVERLEERTREKLALDGRIGEFGKVVANRDEHIRELVAKIRRLAMDIDERDRQVAQAGELAAHRQTAVDALNEQVSELYRREADLARRLAEHVEQADRLQEELDTLRTSSANERASARELRSRVDNLGQQLFAGTLRLHHIEDSSFWRATGSLRSAWRYVENRLLGRAFRFQLIPGGDIEPLGGEYDWRATDQDPYFDMIPADGVYPSGWVLVKSSLRRRSEDRTLKLYYDAGDGLSEATSIKLAVSLRGTVHQLIRLPHGIRKLRWDPMQRPGELSQEPIVISEIGLLGRSLQRFLRVSRTLRQHGAAKLEAKGISMRRLLSEPHRTYEAASALRNHAPTQGYEEWVRAYALTRADREAIGAHIERLAARPLISVLMPVYNTPPALLRAAIESVRAQLYRHWELCIADDASTSPHVEEILEEFRELDARIKVEYRPVNGHISAASNTALSLAEGEFVALLDHDDMLSDQALYQVVAALDSYPQTDIFYSDEDKIDENGARSDPHFKPEWNPDLLFSQNYVSHLGVYRTSLVRQVGGFREGFEGSQDYDLLLRCVAGTASSRVRHIPAILYHWRAISGSTALDEEDKGYATPHGIRALEDYFRSCGLADVYVEAGRYPTTYRVRFPLPASPPKVSLIVPTRDGCDILRACITSIRGKTTYPNYEIVVVDNQSTDRRTLRYFDELEESGVRVLHYDEPFNYSAINNFAVEHSNGAVVGLINNDIEVISPDWLTEMVSHALRPEIGAVGAKLYYGNDTIQHAGVIVGLGGVAGHSHKHFPRDHPGYSRRLFLTQSLSAVTAACLVVRKESYLKVLGLDAKNLAIAFNDVDFCLRLTEVGLRNIWTPHAELYHHESISRGPEDSPEKVARFQKEIRYMAKRWGERLRSDPYYSPMLTLDREDFGANFAAAPPKPWLQVG